MRLNHSELADYQERLLGVHKELLANFVPIATAGVPAPPKSDAGELYAGLAACASKLGLPTDPEALDDWISSVSGRASARLATAQNLFDTRVRELASKLRWESERVARSMPTERLVFMHEIPSGAVLFVDARTTIFTATHIAAIAFGRLPAGHWLHAAVPPSQRYPFANDGDGLMLGEARDRRLPFYYKLSDALQLTAEYLGNIDRVRRRRAEELASIEARRQVDRASWEETTPEGRAAATERRLAEVEAKLAATASASV